jgi:tetratricopeptide (TPR) repeat protein
MPGDAVNEAADQIVSLLGDRLEPPDVPEEERVGLEAALKAAQEAVAERPNDPDALIWLGRRTAYLGRYHDAIRIYGEGIARFPDDARFYRHRGHRHITLRQFEAAVADLEQAARLIAGRPDEVEPDGRPNARNIPTSTLHSNIWYHLALARYLRGEFEAALPAYHECLGVSGNADMLVATSYWLVMTLRRLGRAAEAEEALARITAEMDVIENGAYHRLLLLFRGSLAPDALLDAPDNSSVTLHDATSGYGIGVWHLVSDRPDEARHWFRRVYGGKQWAAFGFIAAEVELSR